jgi:hypothetical protein
MNKIPGIHTIESCYGHDQRQFRIWFKSDSLEHLPRLLYYFDECHNGFPGWSVAVSTDCAMSPVTFKVSGPVGSIACQQANSIAELLETEAKKIR